MKTRKHRPTRKQRQTKSQRGGAHMTLLNALKSNNIEKASRLMESIDESDIVSIFLDEAYNGNINVVKSLINLGIDVNITDASEHTPIMFAAMNNKTDIIKLLLENGANINAISINEYNALMYALMYSAPDSAKLLIKSGIDVNYANSNGTTALMYAAEYNNLDIVKLLIEYGANLNKIDASTYAYTKQMQNLFKKYEPKPLFNRNAIPEPEELRDEEQTNLISLNTINPGDEYYISKNATGKYRTLGTKESIQQIINSKIRGSTKNAIFHPTLTKLVSSKNIQKTVRGLKGGNKTRRKNKH